MRVQGKHRLSSSNYPIHSISLWHMSNETTRKQPWTQLGGASCAILLSRTS